MMYDAKCSRHARRSVMLSLWGRWRRCSGRQLVSRDPQGTTEFTVSVTPSLGETFVAHLFEGGIAGGMTAIVTTPIDCSITRLMLVDASSGASLRGVDNILDAAGAVWREQGPIGFTRGWATRAAQFGPAAMLFFSAFEGLYYGIERL